MKDECVFCNFDGPILRDFRNVIVFEPLNPVTPGHVLAVPKVHFQYPSDQPSLAALVIAKAALWVKTNDIRQYNFIISAGKAATQTIKHMHLHIIPRRPNDGLKLPWSKD